MSVPIVMFAALVVLGAAVMITSVLLFVQVLRRVHARFGTRLAMALLLPWGAFESWRRGRRTLAAVWALSIVGYVIVRVTAGATTA